MKTSAGNLTRIGDFVTIDDGILVKIGERNATVFLLWINHRPDDRCPKKVWLETIIRYVSVWYENLHRIEDLTIELEQWMQNHESPPWLSRLLFQLAERERKQLSIDLHDSALQEQIIWYRRMESLCLDHSLPPAIREEMQRIREGMNEVMYQIRLTCNELRPPFLKGMVQELLNNATKHSNASYVKTSLANDAERIELRYQDNGIGIIELDKDLNDHMGLFGMKERVRSMGGEISFCSSPEEGFQVLIFLPLSNASYGDHI